MKAAPVTSKTVLVTGCSSGIGLATARLLRERGWTVYPTARKFEDLEMLKADGFEPIQLDVSESHSVKEAAAEALKRCDGNLGGVVNNAGFGQPGAIEDLDRDTMRYQFEVNLFGLQELTNLLIPAFRRQKAGRIVNVSSVLGRVPLSMMGIYSASKFAVEAVSDALRVELSGSGVAVSIIEPGPIATEFKPNAMMNALARIKGEKSHFMDYYKSKIDADKETGLTSIFTAPPEAVARKIRHAMESRRPRRRYPVTLTAHFCWFMRRFSPDWVIDAILATRLR